MPLILRINVRWIVTHHPREREELTEKGSIEPKTASPRERVREFPDECLTVTGKKVGKPFCNVCCEKLSLQRNSVANHIGPNKHKSSKEKLTSKEAQERDYIAKCLKVYENMSNPVGEILPMEQRVYMLQPDFKPLTGL